jgi:CHAD domain-containing protein
MGYHIRRDEDVRDALRRVAAEQIDRGIREIENPTIDRHEVVHSLRKRCKKLRGLLRLFRPLLEQVFEQENAFFRDLARGLSFVRDAQALIEAYHGLLVEFSDQVDPVQLSPLGNQLTHSLEEAAGNATQMSARLESVAEQLNQARQRVAVWNVHAEGFEAVAPGLIKNYRQSRKSMRRAYAESRSEDFHEWRKRVKYHWHHARLLRNISPRLLKPHRRMADELGQWLGQEHDLAVLNNRILQDPQGFGTAEQRELAMNLIAQRQEHLRMRAKWLGQRLFAEKSRRLAIRWGVYWQTWQSEPKA